MNESLEHQALRELISEQCMCGGRKKKHQSFCRKCYFKLPKKTQIALYTAFSDGYAEIYDRAKEELQSKRGDPR